MTTIMTLGNSTPPTLVPGVHRISTPDPVHCGVHLHVLCVNHLCGEVWKVQPPCQGLPVTDDCLSNCHRPDWFPIFQSHAIPAASSTYCIWVLHLLPVLHVLLPLVFGCFLPCLCWPAWGWIFGGRPMCKVPRASASSGQGDISQSLKRGSSCCHCKSTVTFGLGSNRFPPLHQKRPKSYSQAT
ncbi:hypothetical protein DSO57_1031044 [Entomophthora muscae]|uniref:Uncharacterized protein n=1 Tax=Entomophthora muscae TaxID=34485 RepID=A0ACC2TN54_9FUNG|nr:hypothetical protein DSO57_1031044 [Entomophthora muscae]